MNKKTIIMTIAICVLSLFILSMFVIKPAIERRDNRIMNQGVEYAVFTIMQQAATCQIVPLTLGNQTIVIVAVDCLQEA